MDSVIDLGIQLCDLAEEQADWSQATFGRDAERGPIRALRHLQKAAKEAEEAAATINVCRENGQADNSIDADPKGWEPSPLVVELADCLLLLLDASRRSGLSPMRLVLAARDKMKVNRSRKWPTPTSDEPVEHVR